MKRLPSFQEMVAKVSPEVTWRRALLAAVLTMNLRIFQFFPGVRPLEEAWFALCLLTFVCLYTLFKANADWRFSRLELYLLGLIVVLVAIPAVSAFHVFGQPLIYGVLARRSAVLITTWLLLIHAWEYGWVDAHDIERALIFVMWFVAVIFVCMRLFLDPRFIPDPPLGFVLGFGTETQVFAAPGYLFPFGTIYYALRGIREGRLKFYLFAVAAFFAGAGSSWRSLVLSLSVTLLFFLFRWKRLDQAVWMLTKFALTMLVVLAIVKVVKPGFISDTVDHFSAAVQVTLGGQEHTDPSADARVDEVALALPYVKAHPLFGAGGLSGQWSVGPREVIGGYFSDSDIGLLGILFTYGSVGFVYGTLQYLLAVSAALAVPAQRYTPLFDAAKGYLLFTAFFSIFTGFFVIAVENTSFFLVLLVVTSGNLRSGVETEAHAYIGQEALEASF